MSLPIFNASAGQQCTFTERLCSHHWLTRCSTCVASHSRV